MFREALNPIVYSHPKKKTMMGMTPAWSTYNIFVRDVLPREHRTQEGSCPLLTYTAGVGNICRIVGVIHCQPLAEHCHRAILPLISRTFPRSLWNRVDEGFYYSQALLVCQLLFVFGCELLFLSFFVCVEY